MKEAIVKLIKGRNWCSDYQFYVMMLGVVVWWNWIITRLAYENDFVPKVVIVVLMACVVAFLAVSTYYTCLRIKFEIMDMYNGYIIRLFEFCIGVALINSVFIREHCSYAYKGVNYVIEILAILVFSKSLIYIVCVLTNSLEKAAQYWKYNYEIPKNTNGIISLILQILNCGIFLLLIKENSHFFFYVIPLMFIMFQFESYRMSGVYNNRKKIKIRVINQSNNYIKKGVYALIGCEDPELHIMELEFNGLFPVNSVEQKVYIDNVPFYSINKYVDNINNKSLYVAIDKKNIRQRKKYVFLIRYKYKIGQNVINKKIYYYVELVKLDNMLYTVKDYIIKDGAARGMFAGVEGIREENFDKCNKIIALVARDIVYISEKKPKQEVLQPIDSRLLLHDGIYGIGKTTYDILKICDMGYMPVIVSPWEDNTSQDLTYVIFNALKKETKMKARALAKELKLLFIIGYTSICFLLENFISNIIGIIIKETGVIKYMPLWLAESELEVRNQLLYYCVALVLGIFLRHMWYPHIVDKIMIYKNQFNDYYREAMIKDIAKMLDGGMGREKVLLIEDIDRLQLGEIQNVFRELSFLNRRYNKASGNNRIIGIASFDQELMLNKFIEREGEEGGVMSYGYLCKKLFAGNFMGAKDGEENLRDYKESVIEDLLIIFDEIADANSAEKVKMKNVKVLEGNIQHMECIRDVKRAVAKFVKGIC